MNGTTPSLSRFTPSLMPFDLLERLFVGRDAVREAILRRIVVATDGTARNHTLLVGPRGAGKTHLVALVYHGAKAMQADGLPLSLAWLPEDPWTIASYRHLLAAIVARLEPASEGEAPRTVTELEELLAARAASSGPIVVLVENFDQILTNLGDEGQQRLRHLLQADRSLLLVATTTCLDRDLSDQARPFYAFFTTSRLEPFSVDEAAEMLSRIATEQGDDRLRQYLAGSEGRARLATIAHLAGGQPRMWAALASALTVGRLEELVDLLLTRFDDLTPYYQEQLGRLSPQQRLVVAELAEVDRPLSVSQLAARLEIDQRSLGKTMTELADRGWAAPTASPVTARLDRRRTYYELAEPLARLSFQLKESRGEPIRLVIDFLKMWFDPKDLAAAGREGVVGDYLLRAVDGHDRDSVVGVARRLQRLPVTRAPAVDLLGEVDDALTALQGGDAEPFLRLPSALRAAVETQLGPNAEDPGAVPLLRIQIHLFAAEEFGDVPHDAMARWVARAEDLVTTSDQASTPASQAVLAGWLARAWRFDDAAAVLEASMAAGPEDWPLHDATRAQIAMALWSAGRFHEAIAIEEAILAHREATYGPDHEATLVAASNLAVSLRDVGQFARAMEIQERVLTARKADGGQDHPDTLAARSQLAHTYWSIGRTREAVALEEALVADTERVLGADNPSAVAAKANLAGSLWSAGRAEDAIALSEVIVADRERLLGPDHPETMSALGNLAVMYESVGRSTEAIEIGGRVLAQRQRTLGPDHPDTLLARGNLAGSYDSVGRVDEAIAMKASVVSVLDRILGPDHPDTLLARGNLAYSHYAKGDVALALGLEEQVAADTERVLGSEHPAAITACHNLACSYWAAGRAEEAIATERRVVARGERVLGPDHPDAQTAQRALDRWVAEVAPS